MTDKRFKVNGAASRKGRRPEYSIWIDMIRRCYNKKNQSFHRYGGRGISVCDSWKTSFTNFFNDMNERPSPKHSLNRIDNDGNYEPKNCEWATILEQQRNRSDNRKLLFNGEIHCISEWAEITKLSSAIILYRLKIGWSIEKTLTTLVHIPKKFELDGIEKSIKEWAEIKGISRHTIKQRLNKGWSIEKTLTTPPDPKKQTYGNTKFVRPPEPTEEEAG